MTILFFNNNRGLIHGKNPKRMSSIPDGVLNIGDSNLKFPQSGILEMPILCGGQSGEFEASFTKADGTVYKLLNVRLEGGRIVPSDEIEELVDLHRTATTDTAVADNMVQQKQEAINALNKHPLKSIIE